MAKILQLPVELLDAISKQSGNDDLRYVCRIFNVITSPYLYRRISLHHRRPDDPEEVPNLQLLLRTLVARPELGAYVRELIIEFYNGMDKVNLNTFPHPISSQFREFAASAAARGLSLEIQLALANGSISAMLFLLFYYTPALEFLVLNSADNFLFHHIASASTSTLPPGLRSLREVSVVQYGSRENWSCLVPFFRLPSLSAFHCAHLESERRIDEKDVDYIDRNLEERSSPVEIIDMQDIVMDGDVFASIVRSCRKLRTLSFQYPLLCGYGETPMFGPPLGDALRQCTQQTLQSLELDFASSEFQNWESPGLIGSLRDFVCLKHISVALSLLIDDPSDHLGSILPPSLTSLSLWIDPDWEEKGDWPALVVDLLESKQEFVPSLKTLFKGGCGGSEGTVRAACHTAGVAFAMIAHER
jgi:hypothetical protein